ncbi:MAG: Cell division protein FtsK [Myxococcaceae bacterium]|nr:Cell division protein FtsK [Myxococcaceae bacterium]
MGRASTAKATAKVAARAAASGAPSRRREVLGIFSAALTALTILSLCSYDARAESANLVGAFGFGLGNLLTVAFGVTAWIIPFELAAFTGRLFAARPSPLGLANLAAMMVLLFVGCALIHLGLPETRVFGGQLPGGTLGSVFGELLRSLFGFAGAFVVGVSVLLVTLVLRTTVSVTGMTYKSISAVGGRFLTSLNAAKSGIGGIADAWREAKELERIEREGGKRRLTKTTKANRKKKPAEQLDLELEEEELEEEEEEELDEEEEDDDGEEDLFDEEEEEDDSYAVEESEESELAGDDDSAEEEQPLAAAALKARAVAARKAAPGDPTIVAPSPDALQRPVKVQQRVVEGRTRPFELPATSLLEPIPAADITIDKNQLKQNAAKLVEKLEAYGVTGRVDEIHPGPVVTMYEFEPKSGTKISKIAGLSDDLAMSLAAQKVRIVAPIPGKARVGFELPNPVRQTVSMRQIIEDERWEKQTGPLPIALGKDIAGQPYYGDLSKMPHLLVAGATGAGKSVGLNVMLASLLFKRTPEEVRLLMIDPKMVELAVYDGIPHMLLPVVTDMKKASLALRWAVDEMERRYQLFSEAGARNVTTYNQRVEKVISGEMPAEKLWPGRAGKVKSFGPGGEEIWLLPDGDEEPDPLPTPEKLPYVVLVVDEFADLMMVAAKDVESAIARLAQKARAAGIHVILATQRPSVDVITGMIKANFPARIAFKVSQREDSKTILGRQGAEHLLGMGDMLMIPPGASDLKRVHSAYISEDEVTALCDFLRTQGKPVYDESILRPRDDDDGGGVEGTLTNKSDDPLYDRSVAIVAQAGYCSISHLQRQLGVGYNKAAKLVERMEKDGVVGPASGKAGGRRDVLIQSF